MARSLGIHGRMSIRVDLLQPRIDFRSVIVRVRIVTFLSRSHGLPASVHVQAIEFHLLGRVLPEKATHTRTKKDTFLPWTLKPGIVSWVQVPPPTSHGKRHKETGWLNWSLLDSWSSFSKSSLHSSSSSSTSTWYLLMDRSYLSFLMHKEGIK